MRSVFPILLFFLSLLPLWAFPQDNLSVHKIPDVDSIIAARGEAYISIAASGRKSFIPLTRSITPDKETGSRIFFYVNREQLAMIRDAGLEFNVLQAPSMLAPVRMAGNLDEVLSGTGYPTYQQYLDLMSRFRDSFPEVCKIDTIGYSMNGRLILSARLQNGTYTKDEKPVVFFSSTMHGDETLGYSLMLMLIGEILYNPENSGTINDILNNLVLIVNPLSNPDGAYFQSDTSLYGAIRLNKDGYDLNRYFPDGHWLGTPDSLIVLPKENQAMVDYMKMFPPNLSANFHGGAELLNYPWDSWYSSEKKHADNNWFIEICKDYVDLARATDPQYLYTFAAGYVFGGDWYKIYGGRQDYVTHYLKGREVTMELSEVKLPDASQLHEFYLKNRDALLNYISKASYGIHGTITDSSTMEPVVTKVEIPGYDKDGSSLLSSSQTGKFFRFLPTGTYNLQISAPGYQTENIPVEIIKDHRIDLPVKLVKKETEIIVMSVAGTSDIGLLLKGDTSEVFTASLYDLSGRKVQEKIFIGNSGTIQGNGLQGIYILRVQSACQSMRRLVFFNGMN